MIFEFNVLRTVDPPYNALFARNVLYQHKQLHLNKASAVRDTSKAVIKFWKEAGIKPKKIASYAM